MSVRIILVPNVTVGPVLPKAVGRPMLQMTPWERRNNHNTNAKRYNKKYRNSDKYVKQQYKYHKSVQYKDLCRAQNASEKLKTYRHEWYEKNKKPPKPKKEKIHYTSGPWFD